MNEERTLVLSTNQIEAKLNRIAQEIVENNFEEEKIYIVGIEEKGFKIAEKLKNKIAEFSSHHELVLASLDLDKDSPLSSMPVLSINLNELANKCVILVDDVLNSGRTLAYATVYLLHTPIKKLQTTVLVDRKHRRFPIRADIVGLTLSTTIQEHISVVIESDQSMKVYIE